MSEYLPPFLALDAPIPAPGGNQGPVCFRFDAKWIPYILAVVKTLTLEGVWANDQDNAMGEANQLVDIFMGKGNCSAFNDPSGSEIEDCMGCCIRMRNGILQVLQCGEWVTVDGWDTSAIAPAQPGQGSPQPAAGGCQNFTGIISPTGSWLLPVPVSTGDVITIKNLNGAWSPSAFTDIWDCPDGNLYFAGGCVGGTAGFDSGAPMPSAPLNGTICYDGTHYYDVSAAAEVDNPVSFTILSGITNKQLLVRCNLHGGVDPSGEVSFDIEVCKGTPSGWTHTFSFALSTDGFTPVVNSGVPWGAWSAGTGFVTTDVAQTGGDFWRAIWVDRAGITPFALDTVEMRFNFALGHHDNPTSYGAHLVAYVAGTPTDEIAVANPAVPNGSNQVLSGTVAVANVDRLNLFFTCSEGSSFGVLTGSEQLLSITITGHGPQPVW